MRKKIALFDLDGTLRQSKSGNTFINNPFDQKPILDNWKKAMVLKSQGWHLAGITNRGCVAEGQKTLQSCMMEQLYALDMLNLDLLLFCPDDGRTCWEIDPKRPYNGISKNVAPSVMFRKPFPGMLLRALTVITGDSEIMHGHKVFHEGFDFKNFNNEKHNVFYCGDRPEDKRAAEAIDIKFIDAKDFANDKTITG